MRSLTWNPRTPDVVGGALLSLLGGGFALGGAEYGIRTPEGQLAPGAMPFLSGTLLIVFGLCVVVSALRIQRGKPLETAESPVGAGEWAAERPEPGAAEADGGGSARAGDSPLRVFALIAVTGGAVAAITWFDTFITLAVLIFVVLALFERVRPWKSIVVALSVVGVCYMLFSILLEVPLPSVF